MKALAFLLALLSPLVVAKCPVHTAEQGELIYLAYYTGLPEDLGYTLAAIVVQEAFVGGYIIRLNERDRGGGSWGITHIQLKTAMWLEGEDNVWRAKQDIVPKLITSDAYALHLALLKLRSIRNSSSYMELWGRYNGGGKNNPYAKKIRSHVQMLQNCYEF